MSPLIILPILVVIIGIAVLAYRRVPAFLIEPMPGMAASVGTGGLSGKKLGHVRFHGKQIPARIDPSCGRDVLAADTAVVIRQMDEGVALVAPKD